MHSELLLYPDYFTPIKVVVMLRIVGYFGEGQIYCISPADLDFIQIEPSMKKTCYNSLSNFMSKYLTIPKGSVVLLDGYLLHCNMKLRTDVRNIFLDSINLEHEHVMKFGKKRAYYINPSNAVLLYNTLIVEELQDKLDSILLANQEFKHVIFGNKGEILPYEVYKNSIKEFNSKDTGMLYINKTPIRPISNVDWLHITTMTLPADVEYTIFQLYRNVITSKPLKVMFYVKPDELDRYNAIAEHLSEHVKSGQRISEHATEIKIVNGKLVTER